jgi:hypothetical protein
MQKTLHPISNVPILKKGSYYLYKTSFCDYIYVGYKYFKLFVMLFKAIYSNTIVIILIIIE